MCTNGQIRTNTKYKGIKWIKLHHLYFTLFIGTHRRSINNSWNCSWNNCLSTWVKAIVWCSSKNDAIYQVLVKSWVRVFGEFCIKYAACTRYTCDLLYNPYTCSPNWCNNMYEEPKASPSQTYVSCSIHSYSKSFTRSLSWSSTYLYVQ